MANTVIQIKRSSTTAAPTNGSLEPAEQAYSFNSDKLFIGNTAGSGVLEIGGKYWVDTTIAAFAQIACLVIGTWIFLNLYKKIKNKQKRRCIIVIFI